MSGILVPNDVDLLIKICFIHTTLLKSRRMLKLKPPTGSEHTQIRLILYTYHTSYIRLLINKIIYIGVKYKNINNFLTFKYTSN